MGGQSEEVAVDVGVACTGEVEGPGFPGALSGGSGALAGVLGCAGADKLFVVFKIKFAQHISTVRAFHFYTPCTIQSSF